MSASTGRIVKISDNARSSSDRVTMSVREGGVTVGKSISGLKNIRQAIVDSATVMKEMGKRAEEIGDIVQAINLIADRTNLLSLNASIEAARAGEHGRGFAVVADEIRALADRAATASADIGKIVRGLQATARDALTASTEGARAADEGAVLASDADRALGTILKGVEELGDSIKEVSRAAADQVDAVQVVGQSTRKVSEQGRAIMRAVGEQVQATQSLSQDRHANAANGQADDAGHRRASARAPRSREVDQPREQQRRAGRRATSTEQATATNQLAKAALHMRASTQLITSAIGEKTRGICSIGNMAEDEASSTQRTDRGAE